MPYRVGYREGGERPWKIINTETGRIVGCSKSKETAEGSLSARYTATVNEKSPPPCGSDI